MTDQKIEMPTKDIPFKELIKACKTEVFLTEAATALATVSAVVTGMGALSGTLEGFAFAAVFMWPAGMIPFFALASERMLERRINREYEARGLAPAFPERPKRILFLSSFLERCQKTD